jgi:hypothetical protein
MTLIDLPKSPLSVLDYEIDYTQWLSLDTITASTWTVPDGLTEDSSTFTSTTTTVWLASGVLGTSYIVTNVIGTAAGRTQSHSFVLDIEQL